MAANGKTTSSPVEKNETPESREVGTKGYGKGKEGKVCLNESWGYAEYSVSRVRGVSERDEAGENQRRGREKNSGKNNEMGQKTGGQIGWAHRETRRTVFHPAHQHPERRAMPGQRRKTSVRWEGKVTQKGGGEPHAKRTSGGELQQNQLLLKKIKDKKGMALKKDDLRKKKRRQKTKEERNESSKKGYCRSKGPE